MKPVSALILAIAPALLAACDLLGIDSPEKLAAIKEADGKAIGSACRHASRAIEDCYTLNPKGQRAAVFSGWKEMDEYMRENKLEGIAPVIPKVPLVKPGDDEHEEPHGAKGAETTKDKASASMDKPGAKPDAHGSAKADMKPDNKAGQAPVAAGKAPPKAH